MIFVHSDIMSFGKLAYIKNKDDFLRILFECLKKVVGDSGTILMPTFTYSFTKNKVYNPEETPSTVGAFTEYFRKRNDVSRTIHPIFSVAVWGKEKNYFTSSLSKNSFGKDSIFDKLKEKNVKLLFFGASFEACTFVHYIEEIAGVKYRHPKFFTGKIKIKDKTYDDVYEYFVMDTEKRVISDFSRFRKYLLENGLMSRSGLGDGELLCADSSILFREGINLIKNDPYFMLKEKPI